MSEHGRVSDSELEMLIAAWQNSKYIPHSTALRAFVELKQRRDEERQRGYAGKWINNAEVETYDK